jgi:hypothetical protein
MMQLSDAAPPRCSDSHEGKLCPSRRKASTGPNNTRPGPSCGIGVGRVPEDGSGRALPVLEVPDPTPGAPFVGERQPAYWCGRSIRNRNCHLFVQQTRMA